ncbi:glycosyl transferase group 1 [Gloeocapsa sp. PCC 7428]|nr:glycosyl transferase group 1 [Gloeocapsa sp. PCC 7428]
MGNTSHMKILVLENEPSSRRGGQEWCLLNTCRGLAQRGHEIHLVYNEQGDFLPIYQQFCQSIIKVNCYLIAKGRLKKFTSAIAWFLSILQLLKTEPDVIYINQSKDAFFAGTIAQLKSIPLVCHLHTFPRKQRFWRQIRTGLKFVTRFLTVSEAARSSYIKAGFAPQTIEVVYNGIDLQRFTIEDDRDNTRQALGIPPEAFVVIYAGRIDRPKNIEMLLAAFMQLKLTVEHAKLLIVGSPVVHGTAGGGEAYVQELKGLCQQLQIDSNVEWLGRRTDLPELFRAADVSVLPSMLPETFGLVLAESMACGTPALGLRYGAIPEVLTGEFECFQFGEGDVSGLADLLRSLQGWQQQDPTLGQRCRAHITQNFPHAQMIVGVEQALQAAIALGAKRLGPSADSLQAWDREASSISAVQF